MANSDAYSLIAVGTTVETSNVIDLQLFDGGHYQVASGSVATITWYASPDGTTYKPAYFDGSPVAQSVDTTNDFEIPTGLNGRRYLKAVGDATGVINVGIKRVAGPS